MMILNQIFMISSLSLNNNKLNNLKTYQTLLNKNKIINKVENKKQI